ncbi:hypothetical protein GCK72_023058 [Caenorhabditis remanei]|uniref:Uncharacterized protein n=1 Tax=Caenorhabditis remanei TaxID=31234 RepID=A0A6A5FVY4_CAERE|nr:hypothetical protein GCK72_023058 [Caenorhabditis remanei]KAF1746601.1 hypothetical protein GCK72_023058 [Caenorhabditis remanei]
MTEDVSQSQTAKKVALWTKQAASVIKQYYPRKFVAFATKEGVTKHKKLEVIKRCDGMKVENTYPNFKKLVVPDKWMAFNPLICSDKRYNFSSYSSRIKLPTLKLRRSKDKIQAHMEKAGVAVSTRMHVAYKKKAAE